MTRLVIGVMGPGSCDEEAAAKARAVGRAIAERGAVLLCGGRGGVMAAAAEGARSAGGITVGILPGASAEDTPANAHIDVALFTGLGEARNVVNVCASDALIAIGGGWGTLSEIALAAKAGKPVVLLDSWPELGARTGLLRAGTAEEAVALAFARL
jgi:uncharacterized protein (TIGR00725 family)